MSSYPTPHAHLEGDVYFPALWFNRIARTYGARSLAQPEQPAPRSAVALGMDQMERLKNALRELLDALERHRETVGELLPSLRRAMMLARIALDGERQ